MSRQEQTHLVAAALRAHNRWVARRFVLAVLLLFLGAVVLGAFGSSLGLTLWWELALLLVCSGLFYAYLIWEVNGPIHRAVVKYTGNS